MKNYRKHIDDFFREKLGRYTETPPAEVWEELEGRLDGLTPAPMPHNYFRWLWHVGIVSLLMVLGVSVVRKNISNYAATNTVASNDAGVTAHTSNNNANAVANSALSAGKTATGGEETAATGNNANTQENITGSANQPTNNHHYSGASRTASNNYPIAYTQPTGKNYGSTTTNANEPQQTPNTYNSRPSKPGPSVEINDNEVIAASPNTTLSNTSKAAPTPAATKAPAALPGTLKNPVAKKNDARSKPDFNRLEAGIKGGYEVGFNEGAAQKFVISPYLQYNLSRKLSVMLQPAIKYANASTQNVGNAQSFYQANEDGTITHTSTPNTITIVTTKDTTSWTSTYNTTQSHDSIVKSNRTGGTYMEFEVPILLKYKISKKVSVYGGVNLVYNKLTGVTENTYTAKGISKSITYTINTDSLPALNYVPPGHNITYNVPSFSTYKDVLITPPSNQMNIGYMVGFTYNYSKRWLIDALMEQVPLAPDVKSGYNINTPLSSPYFRLSVGYTLIK